MRASAICLTVILVAGCTTSHGVTGNNVRVVSDAEKDLYKCQFISSVSGFDEYEGNPTVDAENALNDASELQRPGLADEQVYTEKFLQIPDLVADSGSAEVQLSGLTPGFTTSLRRHPKEAAFIDWLPLPLPPTRRLFRTRCRNCQPARLATGTCHSQ